MDIKKKRRVVITGLGTVNPTGNTVAESWANIKAGRCAVGPITAFDTTDFKVKLAAEVKDFDPAARIDKREARKMARFTQFAVAAADEAVRDSGLVAANDQLAGAVVVADLHNTFVGGCIAACLQGGFVQPQNGCHPAGAPRRSRSHCLTAEGG